MSVEFIRRFATGDYEYAEIRSDDYKEFVEANAGLIDLLNEGKAVETVKKTFGKTTEVKSGGFGNKGKQQSAPETRELGEHDGYKVVVRNGQYGYYFNAYKKGADPERINQNLADGQDPASVTLQDAVEALNG